MLKNKRISAEMITPSFYHCQRRVFKRLENIRKYDKIFHYEQFIHVLIIKTWQRNNKKLTGQKMLIMSNIREEISANKIRHRKKKQVWARKQFSNFSCRISKTFRNIRKICISKHPIKKCEQNRPKCGWIKSPHVSHSPTSNTSDTRNYQNSNENHTNIKQRNNRPI